MKNIFLSRYTPSLMKPEILEAILVQRGQLIEDLVSAIRDSALTANKHFRLLVGTRGIGKTHTISLVYYRLLSMDDLKDKLLIAWLREEERGITSFLKLILRVFRALQEQYPEEYRDKLQPKVQELYRLSSDEAEYRAKVLLKDFVGDKTLLLLIENLDDVFAGLGVSGQKQLRAYIQNDPFLTILATTPSLFNGVKQKDAPFYGFFYSHHLEELSLDEVIELLIKIAELEENEELKEFLQSPVGRKRVEAIHHLAGGNHRVYVIFAGFLTRQSLDELVESFMRTLDELTPYYQEQIARLSPQQQEIIEFLCDRRGAVPVKEIASYCFTTHQTISSQLKELRSKRYVTCISRGRESFYELREILMRFCFDLKKHKGEPIRLLVDFLRCWYTPEELWEQLKSQENVNRQYILEALDIKSEKIALEFISLFRNKDFLTGIEKIEKLLIINSQDASLWLLKGHCYLGLERLDEALICSNKAIEIDVDRQIIQHSLLLKLVTLFNLGKFDFCLEIFNELIDLDSQNLNKNIIQFKKIASEKISISDSKFNQILQFINNDNNSRIISFWLITFIFSTNWEKGIEIVNQKFYSLVDETRLGSDFTVYILKYIFSIAIDTITLKKRIQELLEVYDHHNAIFVLALSLTRSASLLVSGDSNETALKNWLEIWQEVAGTRSEFQISLRLLNAVVRYRETKGDDRAFLELPIEERKLLIDETTGKLREFL